MIDTTNKTLQQVSDEIAKALIKQGKQCVDSNGDCVYQDDLGNHCAVGFLLESGSGIMGYDGSLQPLLSDFEATELGVNGRFLHDNWQALKVIQCIHDANDRRTAQRNADQLEKYHNVDVSAWSEWIEARPVKASYNLENYE